MVKTRPVQGQIIEYKSGKDSKLSPRLVAEFTAENLNCFGHMPGYADTFKHGNSVFVVSGDHYRDYQEMACNDNPDKAAAEIAKREHRVEVVA